MNYYMTKFHRKEVLVILGPTATGKTDLALYLAQKFNGELISADSRQVYKGLDIGTGKIPNKVGNLKMEDRRWIVDGIAIHMYDVISPKRQYHVTHFVKDAEKVINGINKRKRLPILVGGTGLYIRALVDGLSNIYIPADKKLRKELENLTVGQLQEKLKALSKDRWGRMNYSDRQNPRRLFRAIELASIRAGKRKTQKYDVLRIGLIAPREVLYKGSDERVMSRIRQGMIEEANRLKKMGLSLKRMKQLGLEYGVLANYLEGQINNREELIKNIQGKIHGYIRRQLTWFKKEKDVNWFDITRSDTVSKVEKLVGIWYSHFDA